MRNGLRGMGPLVGIVTVVVWLATGAHPGWTKTKVTVMQVDPITEIEYPETRDQFVAGVDVLGGGLLVSLALLGSSFLFKRPDNHEKKGNQP